MIKYFQRRDTLKRFALDAGVEIKWYWTNGKIYKTIKNQLWYVRQLEEI